MSEDVSATMRVGITVILVAALVATVLNLMVMTNSLLSGGQTTLQSGIDSVSAQEFASYDNTKVSGTQVNTALALFQGRDVAILVQTSALREAFGTDYFVNYGALMTANGQPSASNNMVPALYYNNGTYKVDPAVGSAAYTTFIDNKLKGGWATLLTPNCKTAYIATVSESKPTTAATGQSCYRESGAPNYTGQLHNTNGIVDSCYDTINVTTLGNSAYLLSSARFSSCLIKDPSGSIIGIVFKQIN